MKSLMSVSRLIGLFGALLTLTSATSAFAQSANYKLDETHTAVIFSISHIKMSYTYGRFNQVSGNLKFDSENVGASVFQFSMDADSVDSNNEKRDEHLKGADFFNVKQFPKIEFSSTSVEKTEDGINVTGNLTMHGETKEIVIPFKILGQGESPFGDYRIGLFTQFTVKRSDFGMSNMLQAIGDDVAISFSFEGVRE